MHRFVRPVSCIPLNKPLLKALPQKSFLGAIPSSTTRAYTTSSHAVKSHMPFKSIAASVALTSAAWYYLSAPPVQAEAYTSSTPTFSNSTAYNTISELKNAGSRIAVESKSTQELAMALFVYRLCALPWLVDAAPHVISLSEKLHLQGPVYWFVKQTFFRHFCGGETSEECISTMNKLSDSNIGCILDLSVEADLHVEQDKHVDGQSKYSVDEQKADAILGLILNCVRTAAGGVKANAMAAVKVTAFSPPELLLRLNQVITALDQTFLENQHNGNITAEGIRHVVEKVIPAAESEEQQHQREAIIAHLESKKATLDVIEFRKLFNLQGPGRDIWWKTSTEDNHAVLLTAEDLAAYDRMMARLEQVSQLAYDLNVGIMVDAEQSYFQDAIDHVAINLQRKFNRRIEGEEKQPIIFNTCKFIICYLITLEHCVFILFI